MSEYERNHYIPNKVVKNFATREENGKYKVNIQQTSIGSAR